MKEKFFDIIGKCPKDVKVLYLRYALYNATKYVCYWNPVFAEYLAKKRAEGKHYNVALSHATKKLVRLIYALQKSGKAYLTAA